MTNDQFDLNPRTKAFALRMIYPAYRTLRVDRDLRLHHPKNPPHQR
jgi:hypothetical protein